jgi:hypothetical protein
VVFTFGVLSLFANLIADPSPTPADNFCHSFCNEIFGHCIHVLVSLGRFLPYQLFLIANN